MTDTVEKDCPICNSSGIAKEPFATPKVAERVQEKARRDATHQYWIDEHAENGTLAEIRAALSEHDQPRQSG